MPSIPEINGETLGVGVVLLLQRKHISHFTLHASSQQWSGLTGGSVPSTQMET